MTSTKSLVTFLRKIAGEAKEDGKNHRAANLYDAAWRLQHMAQRVGDPRNPN